MRWCGLASTRNGPSGSQRALSATTLETFVAILGAEAGNLALKVLATGGVYLAGGIPIHVAPLLGDGRFMRPFRRKGRFAELLSGVPVHLVATRAALLGAARYGFGPAPAGSLPSDVVIMLLHIPDAIGPVPHESLRRNERPIFVLEQRPQFRGRTAHPAREQRDQLGERLLIQFAAALLPGGGLQRGNRRRGGYGLLGHQTHALPENVAGIGGEKERPLIDGEVGGQADSEQPFVLLEP